MMRKYSINDPKVDELINLFISVSTVYSMTSAMMSTELQVRQVKKASWSTAMSLKYMSHTAQTGIPINYGSRPN